MKTNIKKCIGLCPNCGSENITYTDGYIQDKDYVYDCMCDDCEQEFTEYYDVVYSETRWEEQNENL